MSSYCRCARRRPKDLIQSGCRWCANFINFHACFRGNRSPDPSQPSLTLRPWHRSCLGIAAPKEGCAMELFDQSLTVMEKSLDLRMANQRLVAANLANVDTPGYKAERID